jgi:hypothetical protein
MFSKSLVEGALSIRRRLERDRNNSPGSGGVRHTAAPMNRAWIYKSYLPPQGEINRMGGFTYGCARARMEQV